MDENIAHSVNTTNLADIIERVLDKGVVIAGDIKIQIADIDLLTIKIRLLVASVDKAMEMGINWWRDDAFLSIGKQDNDILNGKVEKLEETIK
jgi:hypothetical protein